MEATPEPPEVRLTPKDIATSALLEHREAWHHPPGSARLVEALDEVHVILSALHDEGWRLIHTNGCEDCEYHLDELCETSREWTP